MCPVAAMVSGTNPLVLTPVAVEVRPLKTSRARLSTMESPVGFVFRNGMRMTPILALVPKSLLVRRFVELPLFEVQPSPLGPPPVQVTRLPMAWTLAPPRKVGATISMPGMRVTRAIGAKLPIGLQGRRWKSEGPTVRAVMVLMMSAWLLGPLWVIESMLCALLVFGWPLMTMALRLFPIVLVRTWVEILRGLFVGYGIMTATGCLLKVRVVRGTDDSSVVEVVVLNRV